MLDHTWLWLNEELSDVRIRLISREPQHDPPSGKGDDPKPEEQSPADPDDEDGEPAAKRARTEATPSQEEEACVQLPAHGTVLGSASEYWKARLLRWRGDSSTREKGACEMLEEAFDSATEVEAAHSILQHAYTGKLPEAATVPLLMEMAVLADKWQMSQAVTTCLDQAAAVQQPSLDELDWLLQDDLPDSITSHAQYQTVLKNCKKALLQQFGRAQVTMADSDEREAFCSLSLRAVQLWAEQDKVKVDSENTVAVLFMHWWEKNSGSFSTEQEATASAALTCLLRVGNLTNSFLYVVEQLPWFRPRKKELGMLRVLHAMQLHKLSTTTGGKLPSGWVKRPRAADDEQDNTLHMSYTKLELEQLHNDAVASRGYACIRQSEKFYWRGYTWWLRLELSDPQGALRCKLRYYSALPKAYMEALPPVVPATFDIKVQADGGPCSRWKMLPLRVSGFILGELLSVPECEAPRSHCFPPDHLWQDDKLQLQVIFKDVR